jgi:hypothetical protein
MHHTIVAIRETRWQETETQEINNHTILFGKCDDRRQFGTCFIVHKSLVPVVKKFKSVNSRIYELYTNYYRRSRSII